MKKRSRLDAETLEARRALARKLIKEGKSQSQIVAAVKEAFAGQGIGVGWIIAERKRQHGEAPRAKAKAKAKAKPTKRASKGNGRRKRARAATHPAFDLGQLPQTLVNSSPGVLAHALVEAGVPFSFDGLSFTITF